MFAAQHQNFSWWLCTALRWALLEARGWHVWNWDIKACNGCWDPHSLNEERLSGCDMPGVILERSSLSPFIAFEYSLFYSEWPDSASLYSLVGAKTAARVYSCLACVEYSRLYLQGLTWKWVFNTVLACRSLYLNTMGQRLAKNVHPNILTPL